MEGKCEKSLKEIKCTQGQVIVIQLPWRGLGGRITPKIGQFQVLRKLSIHDNAIECSIPKELGFLPILRGPRLFNNKFTESLGSCSKLYKVNFTLNSLTGSIPVPITKLKSLMFLDLQFNNFSGVLPDSYSWGNDKNGIKSMVKSLTFDYIFCSNTFSGELPLELTRLNNLQRLSLGNNLLSGNLSSNLLSLPTLIFLDVSDNNFIGVEIVIGRS
uniref:Leucine-rich repeat-containing N-terminal plant-type domain-containing protein n=1 Tax=Lactuca sativa TaxID=4236 RepID=A0A9R1UIX2_LACSA|nr:hypothetical protein LSAT_V11C900488390 [Lactuca sativa]